MSGKPLTELNYGPTVFVHNLHIIPKSLKSCITVELPNRYYTAEKVKIKVGFPEWKSKSQTPNSELHLSFHNIIMKEFSEVLEISPSNLY